MNNLVLLFILFLYDFAANLHLVNPENPRIVPSLLQHSLDLPLNDLYLVFMRPLNQVDDLRVDGVLQDERGYQVVQAHLGYLTRPEIQLIEKHHCLH